jgi:hypothetical protein
LIHRHHIKLFHPVILSQSPSNKIQHFVIFLLYRKGTLDQAHSDSTCLYIEIWLLYFTVQEVLKTLYSPQRQQSGYGTDEYCTDRDKKRAFKKK